MTELLWAPYKEFGEPDPSLQAHEPPAGPILIMAIGYQDQERKIVVYWENGRQR